MNHKHLLGLLALSSSLLLTACGGGGAPTVDAAASAPTSSSASDYTGPAPSTKDVQNFDIYFWQNVRGQNRCGACHNATTPAQMPNFARSDDVNLAYQQANTVVNLEQPSQSEIVIKVSGGHNCWLADPTACGQILTTWISNWAGATGGGGGTQVQLVAPPSQVVGASINFPASPSGFETYLYTPILRPNCAKCHDSQSSTPQSPFFADTDPNVAYQFAIPRINLNAPLSSRFVSRMAVDQHNCWAECGTPTADGTGFTPANSSAQLMLAAIQQYANSLGPATPINSSLVVSKQLSLTQGTVASGAGRYDTAVIAKYEFETGTGLVAYDTSGVDPGADLTLTGDVAWAGGWGITMGPKGGKGQASTSASRKIHDMIEATGEYSVEAWVAPALVAANNAYMVSYSGGDSTRDFTLAQTNQDYDFLMRSSTSDLNGMPMLATPDASEVLQASLQHVVMTYDPINGRKIFVNGVDTGVVDAQKGGTLANWDDTFALVLGNEVSSDRPWQGLIKFAAIHNRALTQAQVTQNFNAGVGQRYYLLFDVSAATGVSQGYVMFTVSQYDSSSYLFTTPTFVSLDPTAKPDGIAIAGIRIGINGAIPNVGQAYIPLNTTVTAANYTSAGEVLSPIGTVIAISSGPLTDQFFLSFDQLGSQSHLTTDPAPLTPAAAYPAYTAQVGMRTFADVNATLSALTGVAVNNSAVAQTYTTLQQQLPSDPTLESYSSANQMAVAQLAIQYCNVAANGTATQQAQLFGSALSATSFNGDANISMVTGALAARVLGTGITSQPAVSTLSGTSGNTYNPTGYGELNALVNTLCSTTSCTNNAARVVSVAAAACAAALGSADAMMIN